MTDYDSVALHGYTSAQGDVETRAAIAEFLNNTHGTHFNADNLYMTMGAAGIAVNMLSGVDKRRI